MVTSPARCKSLMDAGLLARQRGSCYIETVARHFQGVQGCGYFIYQ